MNKFAKKAKVITSTSPVIEGRKKVKVDEIIANYPDGATVFRVDVFTGKKGEPYAVCNIRENENVYFSAGGIFTDIVLDWLTDYVAFPVEEQKTKLNADLLEAGGVKFIFGKSTSRGGDVYTTATVVE